MLMAAVPFVAGSAVRAGKALRIDLPSGAVVRFSGDALKGLANAAKLETRIQRMEVLAPLIRSGEIPESVVDDLYLSGFLKHKGAAPAVLEANMKAVGKGLKPKGSHSHHYLPVAHKPDNLELEFLKRGLDPNYGDFGGYIPDHIHRQWHKGKGMGLGGAYNSVWREFFEDFSEATADDIIKHLEDIKRGDVTALLPDGSELKFVYP